jgi:hypothetical protein
MNWKEITLNEFENKFYYQGKHIFQQLELKDALKFHAPGLAPVKGNSGWYHIDMNGNAIYEERYLRVFGFYHQLAAVISDEDWYHINILGNRISENTYDWCGNFQEGFCTVRNKQGNYFHINSKGKKIYLEQYKYAGDFKYGFACIMNNEQLFTHINSSGKLLHGKWFKDLGVYHKHFATARDKKGWFHIDFEGNAIYHHRFLQIEPFYNGVAFGENLNGKKVLIKEDGLCIHL